MRIPIFRRQHTNWRMVRGLFATWSSATNTLFYVKKVLRMLYARNAIGCDICIFVGLGIDPWRIYIYMYIYIYYPLYTNWPITNAYLAQCDHPIYPIFNLPKAVFDSQRTTVQYRIYWTVSKRGYGHSAYAVATHKNSVNVLNENIINISPSFAENINVFSHRLIFIVNTIFNIGWLTVQYRLYWIQISYIGLGCASSNIAFFVQYNLY